jgi:hypothetical protein
LLYAATSVAFFMVRSPVGANMTRLATTLAAPVLLGVGRRRVVLAALACFALIWQFSPVVSAIDTFQLDPSAHRAFYTPLVRELARLEPGPARLEIPLTRQHWETAWVAPKIALARGWERQLDETDNAVFYDPHRLTRASFGAWLRGNGIRWVALPNAPLDYSAQQEAALLRAGAPYLEPVWRQRDWRLWRVKGSPGLVSGPAKLTDLDPDGFTLQARSVGTTVVRVRSTPTWSIVDRAGGTCLSTTSDSWTVVHASRPGPIRVVAGFLPTTTSSC